MKLALIRSIQTDEPGEVFQFIKFEAVGGRSRTSRPRTSDAVTAEIAENPEKTLAFLGGLCG
jgi:hypothetical protein